jgi:hypothetical protein
LRDKTGKKYSAGNDIYSIAKYANPNRLNMHVINYEKFTESLPKRIKNKVVEGGVCDFIVYSENDHYVLLNELSNTAPAYVNDYENAKGKQEGKLSKAQRQLRHSLEVLTNVPAIRRYMKPFVVKQCCFFNSYSVSMMDGINATQAFNRVNEIDPAPSQLSNSAIEKLGFVFYIYSNNQAYLLERIN